MRVLVVHPKFYIYGGAEHLIVHLCMFLKGRGVECAVLTTEILTDVRNDLEGIEIKLVKNHLGKVRHLHGALFGEIAALQQGVRRHAQKYDLINVHNFPAELSLVYTPTPAVWMCNEPELYLTLEHEMSLKNRCIFKSLLPCHQYTTRRKISEIVVSDKSNSERVLRLYRREPKIIHYGIDFKFFSTGDREDARKRLEIKNKFVVLHVGMLTPFKNQLKSLETVAALKHEISNIVLILAGSSWDESYRKRIDESVKQKDITENVIITGHVTKDEIRQLYYASDVLLHPIKAQGGWLSPFEALCAELPIVVSNEFTAAEIVRYNNIGIVTGDFLRAISEVYRDRDTWQRIAAAGKHWVRGNLSWDEFGRQMLDVFEEILKNQACRT